MFTASSRILSCQAECQPEWITGTRWCTWQSLVGFILYWTACCMWPQTKPFNLRTQGWCRKQYALPGFQQPRISVSCMCIVSFFPSSSCIYILKLFLPSLLFFSNIWYCRLSYNVFSLPSTAVFYFFDTFDKSIKLYAFTSLLNKLFHFYVTIWLHFNSVIYCIGFLHFIYSLFTFKTPIQHKIHIWKIIYLYHISPV